MVMEVEPTHVTGKSYRTHDTALELITSRIFLYLGLLLLIAGGIGEFILGNSFPCVVFFTL